MLNWEKLLCTQRIREANIIVNGDLDPRNQFESDYDRIVGSSSVRRLQDKAQVFPLQKNDLVRTRLTHSIEVSSLAKSMAKQIGNKLESQKIFTRAQTEQLMDLLQVAGLVHDLGNPPFGHYGETIIRKWCKNNYKSENDQEMCDFTHFDGNVQNIRILTKLQTLNDYNGINFTYGTLATLIKYPYKSSNEENPKFKKISLVISNQKKL